MAEKKPQTFENHAKLVPSYHFVTSGFLLIFLLWTLYTLLFRDRSIGAVVGVLLAVALLLMFYHLRIFALVVQDRVIRLEMRLRLREVLPEDLRLRIDELTRGQLVALRFASDAELPELVRDVLDNGITNRTAIKKKIRDWQPDYLRC